MQAFIITLREGVEAALIIGITLSYLAKVGLSRLRNTVYYGLAAALVGSVLVAVVISRTQFNQDIFEGYVMLVAAFFVVTMVFFMAKAGKTLKGDIESKVGGFASRGSRLGLFLFVFLMVLREGVETVLILSAVSLTSTELTNFLGTLLGVALAVAFGVMFVKGSVKINLGKFFKVTTVILIFVAIQLLVSGLHELSENGVLPSSRQEMALIGPIVRSDSFFSVTILALAAVMVLFEYRRRRPDQATASRAEGRKERWTLRRERFWMASVYLSSFVFISLITAEFIYAKASNAQPAANPVFFADGKITIPRSDLADGDLHRYTATVNNKPVRFLLFKKPDGNVAVVLDACQICGNVGFAKGPGGITCKNCSAPVNPQSMGLAGGCNPIPLKASVTAESVVVSQDALASGAGQAQE